jgi:hypothetical protein
MQVCRTNERRRRRKKEEEEEEEDEEEEEEEEEFIRFLAEEARKLGIKFTASETFLCLQLQGAIPCLDNSDPKFLNGNCFLFMKAEKASEVLTFNSDLTRLVAFNCHESLKIYIFRL